MSVLDLSGNGIQDAGTKCLSEALRSCKLHKLHCCFQPGTCDFAADGGRGYIVDESFRTPSDYTCLGYVVVNAKKNTVRMMELDGRASLNEECVEAFIKATNGIRRTASPVELLSLRGRECLEQHLELMRACPSLLVVQWYDSKDIFIDYRSTVSHPSLEIVRITGCSDELITLYCKELMEGFKQIFPNVRNIGVWEDIASATQKHSNPPLCPFYSVYCQPISSFSNGDFHRAKVLTISYDMIITHHCIHDDDEEHDKCLCTHLYLFNCNINNPTAVLLTERFKYNNNLKVLKLVANSIGDEGDVAIADSIKCCSSFHWLDLSIDSLMKEWTPPLSTVKTLHTLYLQS